MIIRQGRSADSISIHKLLEQLGYPQPGDRVIEAIESYYGDGYYLLVVEVDNVIVGFASLHWFDMFHMRGKMGRITAICIQEELRSKGIGRSLLTASEDFLKSKGCVKVEVTTNLIRTLTHEFYAKNGYEINSKRFIKKLD
ncbi:MAG TPA: GNAT family N-acetyltransferase [Chryseolinea sp.]|nr:GNAT family N-acetyltransferase [Chryseolinea sp.]